MVGVSASTPGGQRFLEATVPDAVGESVSAVLSAGGARWPTDGMVIERTPDGFLRMVVTAGGKRMSSRVVSEGTLRALGLLALALPPTPLSLIAVEEPENGIRPTHLSTVARILGTTADRGTSQVVLTTHSPPLLTWLEQLHNQPLALVACRGNGSESHFESVPSFVAATDGSDDGWDDGPTTLGERVARGDFG